MFRSRGLPLAAFRGLVPSRRSEVHRIGWAPRLMATKGGRSSRVGRTESFRPIADSRSEDLEPRKLAGMLLRRSDDLAVESGADSRRQHQILPFSSSLWTTSRSFLRR